MIVLENQRVVVVEDGDEQGVPAKLYGAMDLGCTADVIIKNGRVTKARGFQVTQDTMADTTPELYEALADMVSDYQSLSEDTLERARAALAKARGDS